MKGVKTLTHYESKLIKRCKAGDVDSFEELIEKYQLMAYNIAYKLLNNQEDAKDVTQEALIKVFKSISKFRGDSNFSTWIYRVVYNTTIDYIRKQKNNNNTLSIDKEIEGKDGSFKGDIVDDTNIPEKVYEEKEKKDMVHKALNSLPENYRTVLILRDIHYFSYDEISEITKLPVGTVKSRINRGRQKLKEILLKSTELFVNK